MLVADPQKQRLYVEVVDSLGFADMTMGVGEVVYFALLESLYCQSYFCHYFMMLLCFVYEVFSLIFTV